MEDGKFRMMLRSLGKDEARRKKVEITDVNLNNIDRLRHIEKKLIDKGVLKLLRHPGDGLPRNCRQPKSGHGGKFTWEGPMSLVDNELFFDDVPSAMDKGDPNYVDEEEEWEEWDGLLRNRRQPKSGYGGKFTWEGPRGLVDNELFDDVPSAMVKGDPNYEEWEEFNYVDEDQWEEDWEELIIAPDEDVVVGEVEVAKEAGCS